MPALEKSKIVAVIGAGTMGAGVAQVAANAGHPVLLYDVAEGAALKGKLHTAAGLDKQVQRGRISAVERDELLDRITPVDNLDELAGASLFIEAIIERLDIKQQLFQQLESIADDQAIMASNTSSISITAIAAALKRPQQFLGMHFFNPAPVMKLVEIVSGLATNPELAETIYATAKAWGKLAVHARSTPGFIVNRVARPFYAEGLRLLQEGLGDAATIDAIMRDAGGFRMGPFELMDLIGHDVNYAVTCSVFDAYYGDPRFQPSLIQKEMVDAGYLGQKTGRGFYDYKDPSAKPEAQCCPSCNAATSATISGDSKLADILFDLLKAAGVEVSRIEGDEFALHTENATLKQTDGQMATVRSALDEIDNLVLLDLALDYQQSPRWVITAADQADAAAVNEIIGLLQQTGKQVTRVKDVAGMCVMRTVCMLANEGADAVNQGVCSIEDVDIAMQSGVNYPLGPLAWADLIGVDNVLEVLENLVQNYGEDRYRCSPLILRLAAAEKTFHD